jgi:carboxypeptidase Taq
LPGWQVTYPLHIILRYEIERGLLDGSIKVDDVPKVWNAKMQQYLGVEPPSDAQGCLQDVHWSAGLFGYFPTYSLGAM